MWTQKCQQFRTGRFKILPIHNYIFYRVIKEHLPASHLSLHVQISKFISGQIGFFPLLHFICWLGCICPLSSRGRRNTHPSSRVATGHPVSRISLPLFGSCRRNIRLVFQELLLNCMSDFLKETMSLESPDNDPVLSSHVLVTMLFPIYPPLLSPPILNLRIADLFPAGNITAYLQCILTCDIVTSMLNEIPSHFHSFPSCYVFK